MTPVGIEPRLSIQSPTFYDYAIALPKNKISPYGKSILKLVSAESIKINAVGKVLASDSRYQRLQLRQPVEGIYPQTFLQVFIHEI